ncbi:CUB and sushi domain-containing protein 3-like [Salarias fasciatus]|uniref:CUB and sushi domain-containing protein 3-like n=1 Tax=Salarias fasciatus TaxID=181472 RepID=UPI001176E9D5|nr:CUB and sushi domain-containing protein 3-like [Salarias fasciatus]
MRPGESLEGSRSARRRCIGANKTPNGGTERCPAHLSSAATRMKRATTKRGMRGTTGGGMTALRCFLWSLVLGSLSSGAQGFIYTCGGTLKGRNGSIESPGFPYGYPNGANCTWVIVGEEGSRIQLIFLSFAIEEEYDFLSLYDGHPHPANFRTRLTGFQVPAPVTSTGNVFSLRLTSDFAVSAHGFKLNYEELQSSSCGNPGVPPKAVLSGGGRFAVGDRVRYSCVPGYVLDGHATLTCITNAGNAAVWDFPAPISRAFRQQSSLQHIVDSSIL